MDDRLQHEQSLLRNPVNQESIRALVDWHLERDNLVLARQYLHLLAGLCKTDAMVWLSLAVTCALGGEVEEGYRALSETIRLSLSMLENPEMHEGIKFCQALLFECRGNTAEALKMLYRSVELCDSKLEVQQIAHEAAASQGNFVKENEAFQCITALKERRMEALLKAALIKKDTGEFSDALALVDLISNESAPPPSVKLVAQILCLRGSIFVERKYNQHAEEMYKQALLLYPGFPIANRNLGCIYLRYRECVPSAVICFTRALEYNPFHHTSWYLLGRCYVAASQFVDAFNAYNQAIGIEPNDAAVWCSLGILYYSHGQNEEAESCTRRAVRLEPHMAEAWYNLGVLCEAAKNSREALLCYNKAKARGFRDALKSVGLTLVDVDL